MASARRSHRRHIDGGREKMERCCAINRWITGMRPCPSRTYPSLRGINLRNSSHKTESRKAVGADIFWHDGPSRHDFRASSAPRRQYPRFGGKHRCQLTRFRPEGGWTNRRSLRFSGLQAVKETSATAPSHRRLHSPFDRCRADCALATQEGVS